MGDTASTQRGTTTTAAAAVVRLQLLQAPRLWLADGSVHALERKDAALLAMLAVEGPAPRTRAAALLWPDIDEERARNNLRQRLFRLRKAAACDVIDAGHDALALAAGIAHDLDALGPRLAADPDAVAGDLLGELDYADCIDLADWVRVARDQWRQARRNALAEIAAQFETEGRIAPALAYAQRLAADDPALEHAHRRVMRLHYLRGDRAAALAAFERCREALRLHVGAQPGRETQELARLIEASGTLPQAAPAAARPVAVLRPPRLVGRAREWQRLEHAAEATRAALVSGEPGMGKTRLLSDFARAHGDAIVVGSRPGDARVPYALLAPLLRALVRRYGAAPDAWVNAELAHLLPELGTAAGKFEPLRLQMAATQALAHWHEAGLRLLAVDDLHFADAATLELLPALVGAADARVAWLLGVRANEMPAPIERWLAQQDADALAIVRLDPLDEAAVRELLDTLALPGVDAARLAPQLARHTGGNPLFMLETLGALLAQGPAAANALRLPAPASIGELIERRLLQLSAPALKLARVAAIAGQDFSAALAAHVLGQHTLDLADAWRELEAAQILRDASFAHDLILETAQRSVPAPIARELHGDVAAWLEAHGAPAARIAQHWFDGGDWRAAGRHFRAAAAAAAKASQRAEEARLLERAVACFERADDQPALFEALHELAESHLVFANIAAARAASERLLRTARTDAQRLQALNAHVDSLNVARDHQAAADLAAQMLALAQRVGNDRAAFNASRKLAGAQATLGRHDEALAVHAAQRAWADAHPDDSDVRVYLCDRGYLLEQARRAPEAVDAYRHAIAVGHAQRDLAIAHAALTNLAVTLWRLGRLPEAIDTADDAQRLRVELGTDDDAVDRAQRAAMLRDAGRFREAIEGLEAAVARLAHTGSPFWQMATEDHLALAFITLGQHGRAQRLLAALPDDAAAAGKAFRSVCRAQLARATGRPAREAAAAARAFAAAGVPWRLQLLAAFECAACGDPVEGAALCRQLADETDRCGAAGLHLHALARGADCELRAGNGAAARALAHRALRAARGHEAFGLPRSELLCIAYRALAAAGDAAAPAVLGQGVAWIRGALAEVPEEFRASFVDRNPVHRALLTTASRSAAA